jgi:hypothetical protein
MQVPFPSAQAPAKSKGLGVILAVVGLVVLLVVGVGGFFAFKKFSGSSSTSSEKTKPGDGAVDSTTTSTKEIAQYWFELLPESLIGEPVRAAGAVPLASEQSFKFHFVFKEDGYLYIVGPGEQNKPTAFLTAKPARLSGLDSNRVSKGADFSFPDGIEHWLRLDKKAGTEDYTVIFSPTPLTEPGFLGAEATGSPLGETQQAELTNFLAKNKTSDPTIEINDKDASQPFVAVKAPRPDGAGNPIVFRIRIQHK